MLKFYCIRGVQLNNLLQCIRTISKRTSRMCAAPVAHWRRAALLSVTRFWFLRRRLYWSDWEPCSAEKVWRQRQSGAASHDHARSRLRDQRARLANGPVSPTGLDGQLMPSRAYLRSRPRRSCPFPMTGKIAFSTSCSTKMSGARHEAPQFSCL